MNIQKGTPMLDCASFMDGAWVPPHEDAQTVLDAATGAPVARVGHGGFCARSMIRYATDEGGARLRVMGFHDRAKMIKAVALYLKEHKEALYERSWATGATRRDGAIDIDGGIQTMLVFASKGRREMPDGQVYLDGGIEELSRDGSFKGMHIATPLQGVAVHINAFNFPVWGMLEKLAPAWLGGVPVIVKPASQTAYLTQEAVRLILQSGLVPEGALQLIAGSAGDLLDHLGPQDVVSFTGSEATASKLRAHPNILQNAVRFIGEQDSLNATVLGADISPEMPEFKIFIQEVIREMTTKAGQKCTAIRRILVPHALKPAVTAALIEKLSKTIIGDPREEGTQMGPLVSIAQCQDVVEKARAIAQEAKLVYGSLPDEVQSAFCAPLLFDCDDPLNATVVHSTEAFGPVSTLMGYETTQEALGLLNKGGGSLVASVITTSGEVARAFVQGAGAWHGRLYFNNAQSAKSATGHGSPLPHLIHGGPGRAGGGEEMGGVRGVMHYMQRSAIQGPPALLSAIAGRYVSQAPVEQVKTHPFRLDFNTLEPGMSLCTPSREVTLEDIEHFARFTGDCFYAHMDEEAAKTNPFFPDRVAHGYLLLSFAAGLFVEPSPGPVLANTGLNDLQFLKPVVAGDAIYVTLTVKRKTRRTDEYGEVRWHVEIKNQDDEMVATYELLTMNAYEDIYA